MDQAHHSAGLSLAGPPELRVAAVRKFQIRGAMNSRLELFRRVGFFEEKDIVERHLRDFFASVNRHDVPTCIMFGTLLGKLRHDDIIPWDDDVDIIVFDYAAFLQRTAPELEAVGYIVEPDIRQGRRMGCRIFHRTSRAVPNRDNLRFPWLGIWEHELHSDGSATLPPEDTRYRMSDFLPIRHVDFLGVSVGVPNRPTAILDTYFESDDWMKYCVLPERDHRNGGVPTNFPQEKFPLSEVLEYLSEAGRCTDYP